MIGFRELLKGLALVALTSALAAPAAARLVNTIDGWEINSTSKTCTMTSTFADDVAIALVWAPSTGELGFMAGVPQARDLARQKTAMLELSFDGDGPLTQWEDQSARIVPGGTSTGVIGDWGPEHADQLAKTVAAASHVSVRIGGREVGNYPLSGSAPAYQALMKCGRQFVAK